MIAMALSYCADCWVVLFVGQEMCKELSLLHYQAKTHPWKYTEQVLDKRNPNWRQEWEFLNYKRPGMCFCFLFSNGRSAAR